MVKTFLWKLCSNIYNKTKRSKFSFLFIYNSQTMAPTSNTKKPATSEEYSSCKITQSYHSTHCPQSHLKLFKCPNFCMMENVCVDEEETDRFLKLKCKECNCFWFVCFNCKNQTKHFVSMYQLKRHFYTSCKTKIVGKDQNIDEIVPPGTPPLGPQGGGAEAE